MPWTLPPCTCPRDDSGEKFAQFKNACIDRRINPSMEFATAIRRARKEHRCCGGHDGSTNTPCADPINKGDLYVEYSGESSPFKSGRRYHIECATQQGILLPRGNR